jgi:hypothetical protein
MNYTYNTDRAVVLSNMVEISFVDATEDGFRKVKETLERMGISKCGQKILFQTAHILHKQGHYYIAHFKEMLAMDGKVVEMSEEDIGRRNLIIKYMTDWKLITPITDNSNRPMCHPRSLKVVKYIDRESWEFVPKYSMGNKTA